MLVRHFHRGAPLCSYVVPGGHIRVVAIGRLPHWGESIPRKYQETNSVYTRLLWRVPLPPASAKIYLLQRAASLVSCRTWRRCHGSPVLGQVVAQMIVSFSEQHRAHHTHFIIFW